MPLTTDGLPGAITTSAKARSFEITTACSLRTILPDADVDIAVETAVFYGLGSSGQTCGAASRTLVPRERLDAFLDALAVRVEGLQVGDPQAEDGYVTSTDARQARAVAERVRTGYVLINDADFDFNTSWGGYKQSGNGREWADFGIGEYLETKSIVGVTS